MKMVDPLVDLNVFPSVSRQRSDFTNPKMNGAQTLHEIPRRGSPGKGVKGCDKEMIPIFAR
jgi:hypothetical protein